MVNNVFRRVISAVDRGLNVTVSVLVVSILLSMVLLSFAQVLLRNLLGSGLSWADVVLRHLVLAVGMFGAVLAARQGRQISIDIVSRILSPRYRILLGWIVGLFTITISVILAKSAVVFVASEKSFGSELAAGLAAWPFESVIPAGFALLALQVLLNLLLGRSASELAGVDSSSLPGAVEAVNREQILVEDDTVPKADGDSDIPPASPEKDENAEEGTEGDPGEDSEEDAQ